MNGHCGRIGMACLAWACLLSTGCATLQFPWEKKVAHATARNPVVQVLCLWEPAEGQDPDGRACRGFAGQIIFLGNKGGTPVAVDGKVRVKEYDEISGLSDSAEPFHQFDFDAGSWNNHLHVGTLGATYNVFIPYMRKGNHDAHCELKLEFTPEKGSPVSSPAMPLALKSKKTAKEIAAAAISNSVLPVASHVEPTRGARTTTIPLDGRKPATDLSPREQAMAAQMERLERMVQDYTAQHAGKPANPMAAIDAMPEPTPPPSNRFSLDHGRVVQASATVATPDTSVTQASARIPASGRSQNFLSAHPLAAEESSETNVQPANIAQRPARRHPLADESAFANDESPRSVKRPTTPAPATQVAPEELTDAPEWMREENTAGRASLDGQTTLR